VPGLLVYFSMYTESSLKADFASDFAIRSEERSSPSSRTSRMPLPPPPAVAFIITGKPISFATRKTSSSDEIASTVPGTTGTPAACTVFRASVLDPIVRIAYAEGPISLIFSFSQRSAKTGFSARKP
jgi:hypothetical protein